MLNTEDRYMGASTSTSEDSEKHLIQKVKIALVGQYAVGKTSIITRYTRDTFSSDYIYTRGKIKKTNER
jgi:GTPase SAR1 family protein